jgi:hypothetical protein
MVSNHRCSEQPFQVVVSNHHHYNHFKWWWPLSHGTLTWHDITVITCQSQTAISKLKVCAAEVSNFCHPSGGFKPLLFQPFQVVVSNRHFSNHFKWWWPLSHRTLIWHDVTFITCQSPTAVTELKVCAAEVSNLCHPRDGFKPSLFWTTISSGGFKPSLFQPFQVEVASQP